VRRLIPILTVAAVVIIGLGAWFGLRFNQMRKVMLAAPAADVDLSNLPDGDYEGRFGDFLVTARVRVKVVDHRITAIELIDQHCGPGYEAKATLDRIVAAQSPQVDVVSGATGSSRCLMAAVHRALTAGRN